MTSTRPCVKNKRGQQYQKNNQQMKDNNNFPHKITPVAFLLLTISSQVNKEVEYIEGD
jgi:hypothetical protein